MQSSSTIEPFMLLIFFVMLPFFWLAALASGGPPRVKEPWTKQDVYLLVFSAIVAILAQWWNGFFSDLFK